MWDDCFVGGSIDLSCMTLPFRMDEMLLYNRPLYLRHQQGKARRPQSVIIMCTCTVVKSRVWEKSQRLEVIQTESVI